MAATRSQVFHCKRSVNRSDGSVNRSDGSHHWNGIGTANIAAARSLVFHCKMSVNRPNGSHHRNGKYGSGQVSGVSL